MEHKAAIRPEWPRKIIFSFLKTLPETCEIIFFNLFAVEPAVTGGDRINVLECLPVGVFTSGPLHNSSRLCFFLRRWGLCVFCKVFAIFSAGCLVFATIKITANPVKKNVLFNIFRCHNSSFRFLHCSIGNHCVEGFRMMFDETRMDGHRRLFFPNKEGEEG